MRKALFILALIGIVHQNQAQQVRPVNSSEIYREISQLNHLANVLYLAAHPDDENTRLLTWLVSDRNVRTAYLSITRGDGGQNILGSEQGPALGLIRTHELMEARNIDGAGQYFTRGIDFGYSKNAEETLKHWDETQLAGDVVWIMRKFRPDVVICRFPPTSQAGHGQHASSTIFAKDAFKAAGDKSRYPEQLKFNPVWQPKRLLLNTFRFGNVNTTSEDQFKLTVGQYSPFYGMGYGEMAGIIRSMHKSQGAGTPSVAGTATEYFSLLDGEPIKTSLFDGIDISWNRIGRKDIGEKIKKVLDAYDFRHPELSLAALLEIRPLIAGVKDTYWRNIKLEETDKVILHCSGFMAELFARQPEVTKGMTLPFTLHVISRSAIPVTLKSVQWTSEVTDLNSVMKSDSLYSFDHSITIPQDAPVTEPYWLSEPLKDLANYTIPEDSLLGLPETPVSLTGTLTLSIGKETFKIKVPLSFKKLDPEKGDVVEPLRVVPMVTLDFTEPLIITQPDGSVKTNIRLHPSAAVSGGVLSINSDKPVFMVSNINLRAGIDTVITLQMTSAQVNLGGSHNFNLEASFRADNEIFNRTQHIIRYSHLPTLQYFTNANARVVLNDWTCTAKKIGYIEGAGDYTLQFLKLAGFNVSVLNDNDFADAGKLSQYDAIITEVRSVNVNKKMSRWLPVLHQYVEQGGTLVMEYNTMQDLSTTKIGPYPFTLSGSRVTEEDAKVNFLNPGHRLLNYPNKITPADFNGWIQEIGLYFPKDWDSKYEPLFEMNDTGETALKGGTLYTAYGKGNYIYTSLSFFRQLPVGNEGAIRLLMNMLSAGK
jgi:LmbE family N-acetylglucosaminyl deacetylase